MLYLEKMLKFSHHLNFRVHFYDMKLLFIIFNCFFDMLFFSIK